MKTNITAFLDKQGLIYSQGKTPNVILLSFTGFNGTYHCFIDADEEESRLVFISFLGINCPVDRMANMAELINKLNSNLVYGNFEMNTPSGEIKFRTSGYFNDSELTEKEISHLIYKNIQTIDTGSVRLIKFMFDDTSSIDQVYNELFYPKHLDETVNAENAEIVSE